MKKNLLLITTLTSFAFSLQANNALQLPLPFQKDPEYCAKVIIQPSNDLREMLHREALTLSPIVINKVMSVLECINKYNIDHNNILTIVDYSLPASEKRLWVFDLQDNKLLYHTYV